MNLNRLIIKGKQEGKDIYLMASKTSQSRVLFQIKSTASGGTRTVFTRYLAIVTAGSPTAVPETEKSLSEWSD